MINKDKLIDLLTDYLVVEDTKDSYVYNLVVDNESDGGYIVVKEVIQ